MVGTHILLRLSFPRDVSTRVWLLRGRQQSLVDMLGGGIQVDVRF